MYYRHTLGRLISLLLTLNLGFSASAMEFVSQEIVTENTKLVSSQNFESPETFIPQLTIFEQTPFFPQDIWRKILYKWTLASDVDTKLQWNVGDARSLALTCKGLYQFVNSLETYAIVRDTLLFRALLTKFTTKRGLAPEGAPSIIKKMKALKTSYNDIEKRNSNQVKMLRGAISELDNLSELHILKDLEPIRTGIGSTLTPIIKSMLTYAKENPEGCTKGDIVVDLADLSHISGIPLPPYEYDARRDYRRIFRNKCLIIGGTVLLGSLFLYEGMTLYKQYPQAEADVAFSAMLNQTSKEINYGYWSWRGSSIDCYKKYWFSQMDWGMWWGPNQNYPNGGPGYCYFPPFTKTNGISRSICFPGNVTEWISQVANQSGFNGTYWLDKVLSIMNGTEHDTKIAFCSPNRDGMSISCGSTYSRTSQNHWRSPNGEITLQLTRGDAVCAHDQVIQGWRTIMGLYWGFGSVGSLLFVYLWLIHFLC